MESVAEIRFEDKDLFERWSRVKEDFWGDLKTETVRALKRLLEGSLEVEVQDLMGSERWEHNRGRWTYRNGSYQRGLLTGLGHIADLRVPRVRDGGIKWKTIPRYKQRSKDVDEMVIEMFLAGVSTRRVEEVLRPLMGEGVISAGSVSQISKRLDSLVKRFHNRAIKDEYVYLILDGIFLNAKSPAVKKRRCILVVYGVKRDGKREMIDFYLAPQGESQNAWEHFLNNLYHRGLEGRHLRLVVIDGNKGLRNAIELVYPGVEKQRCWAHKLRNVANKVPKKLQEVCINGAREIYEAESYKEGVWNFKKWARIWRPVVPEAVECLEEDIEELLNFFGCPEEDWRRLRTTNIIERVFREVRRRTRPMSCFQNRESVERIIFAIFYRLNQKWENKPLFKITHNS